MAVSIGSCPAWARNTLLGSVPCADVFQAQFLGKEALFLPQQSELQEGPAFSCFLNGTEGPEHSIQQATRGQQWLELRLLLPTLASSQEQSDHLGT